MVVTIKKFRFTAPLKSDRPTGTALIMGAHRGRKSALLHYAPNLSTVAAVSGVPTEARLLPYTAIS